jgi:hypothetical protein
VETGKPASQSGAVLKVVLTIVIALFVVCIVVPCCVIAVLALLGPQIGNIFSRVTSGLGAP